MKKLLVTLMIALCSIGITVAQDLEKATELYNNAAAALEISDTPGALDLFQQAMTMASSLGEEGVEIVNNCKGIIPKLHLSIGKDYAKIKDMDNAIASLNKATELAKEYGDQETATEASDLIPQLLMAEGNSLLNDKKYPEAAAMYKKVTAIEPDNGMAFLRMGMAQTASGETDAAIETFTTAVEKGEAENANKQLSNIYLKKAAACQKEKDSKGAMEAAQKSVEYLDNATAQKIIGLSALSLKQNKVAADALEAYLAMQPDAKDKVQIMYQLGVALAASGQNSKACGYFKQISSDAKWGEAARYQATTLKCN
ncbi:MAG: tetratricopeptide repeat protein [Bacteroidales bacterium]|nr:tetratricopeptide repeat protein [Bacteroidales bacterium]MDD3200677.1 tetratricopeptide repeat protein [Bacteroidales bacterium]